MAGDYPVHSRFRPAKWRPLSWVACRATGFDSSGHRDSGSAYSCSPNPLQSSRLGRRTAVSRWNCRLVPLVNPVRWPARSPAGHHCVRASTWGSGAAFPPTSTLLVSRVNRRLLLRCVTALAADGAERFSFAARSTDAADHDPSTGPPQGDLTTRSSARSTPRLGRLPPRPLGQMFARAVSTRLPPSAAVHTTGRRCSPAGTTTTLLGVLPETSSEAEEGWE